MSLSTELELPRLLAEAEAMVVMAESKVGLNVPTGRRPLSKPEQKAKVKFGDIAGVQESGYRDIGTILAEFWSDYTDDMVDSLFIGQQEVAAEIATLAYEGAQQEAETNLMLRIYLATDQVLSTLETMYRVMELLSILEAERQGAKVPAKHARNGSVPRQRVRSRLAPLARLVAGQATDRIMENVRANVFTPRAVGNGVVSRLGLELPTVENIRRLFIGGGGTPSDGLIKGSGDGLYRGFKGALDTGRQAVHAASNQGRLEAAQHAGATSAFASEILDGNTCGPCRELDGKTYKSFTEARRDYPPGGGFVQCDGGARCRGTLIFLYEKGKRPLPLGDEPDGPEDPWDDIFGPDEPDEPNDPGDADGWQFPGKALPDAQDDVFTGSLADSRRAVAAAQSPADVRDALRAALGEGTSVEGTWSKRVDLTTAKDFGDSILANVERFPDSTPAVVAIRRLDTPAAYMETLGTADGRAHVVFNATWATTGQRRRLLDALARDSQTGFHPPSTDSVAGLVTHEWGHVLDAQLDGQLSGYRNGGQGRWVDWVTEYAGGDWRGDMAELPNMVQGYSKYALDAEGFFNPPEFLAQAFVDVEANGRHASPLSIFIHRKMLEAYRGSGRTILKEG